MQVHREGSYRNAVSNLASWPCKYTLHLLNPLEAGPGALVSICGTSMAEQMEPTWSLLGCMYICIHSLLERVPIRRLPIGQSPTWTRTDTVRLKREAISVRVLPTNSHAIFLDGLVGRCVGRVMHAKDSVFIASAARLSA